MARQTVFVRLAHGVPGLGSAGDVVQVAFGYARNFLLPRSLAVIVSAGAARQAQAHHQAQTASPAGERQTVMQMAQSLDGRSVTLKAPMNAEGRLFASVQADDVAEALETDPIFRMEPLKQQGEHRVVLDFGHDILATVTVTIQPQAPARR